MKRPSVKPFGKLSGVALKDHLGLRNGLNNWQFTAVSAALGLALAAGVVLAAGPWDSGQRKAEQDWAAARDGPGGAHHDPDAPAGPAPAPSAPAVLAALGTAADRSAPETQDGAAAGLGSVLDPLLKDSALGTRRSAVVIDTATGRRLYGKGADAPMTPAPRSRSPPPSRP